MNQERLLNILKAHHVSEKSSYGSEANRQYVFKVVKDANKTEIKEAVGSLFNVKVNSIRICNMKGKARKFGRTLGRQQDWKKAYVTLAAGSEIDIHEAS